MGEETVLDAATRFAGSIQSEDDLKILGVVEGSVRTSGRVLVVQGGLVQGPVTGRDVEIQGAVEGDIQASGQFLLGVTGKVMGDVRAAHIKVEDGGLLQGKVLMEGPKPFKTHERS
jgi:cytoskeletal protein CcmA (bactofilin family)